MRGVLRDMNVLPLRRACALAAVAAACSGLAACGSSSSSSSSSSSTKTSSAATASGGGGQQLKLAASESGGLKFSKSSLSAKTGAVTITMVNPSGNAQPHAIAVEGNGVDKDGPIAQPGKDSTVTVDLSKPGKYTFYCPVDSHRQAGMQGTLTVQ
jgi:uncharacterized cupredoxin-like copper-binding protein